MSTDDTRDQDVNAVETRAYRVTDDMRPGDPIPGPKVSPVVDSSCAGCERELSAVRLDLISALGQAQEHEAENQRLKDAIKRVLNLTSTYDQETFGRTVHLVNNLQARQMLTDALSVTTRKETA